MDFSIIVFQMAGVLLELLLEFLIKTILRNTTPPLAEAIEHGIFLKKSLILLVDKM